jgi:hypothetical protein
MSVGNPSLYNIEVRPKCCSPQLSQVYLYRLWPLVRVWPEILVNVDCYHYLGKAGAAVPI